MAPSSDPSYPIQPLSVGNVVSAGFQLYGARFQQYLTIALISTLWVLLPFVVTIAVVAFFAVVRDYYALLGLLIPALIALFLYTSGKYLANAALIARLAFGELTSQPESLADARRYVRSRQWRFLSVALLMGLIFLGIVIVFYMALAVVVVGTLAAAGGFQLFQNPTPEAMAANAGTIVLLGLLMFVLLLGIFALFLWLAARFVAPELPLAVESDVTVVQSIARVWDLTQGNGWRIALILFITYLVTLPLQLLVQMVSGITNGVLSAAGITPGSSTYTALSVLIAYVLGLLLSVVVLPLWQIIKAVVYYDLRSRREGLGLQLRDRST